jgi:hypothetical protein
MSWIATIVQFGQPISDYAAHKARGVRHQFSKVLGVARDWLLSRTRDKHLHKPLERCGVLVGNCPLCTRVVLVRAKGALGHHYRTAQLVTAVVEPKLGEVAGAPAAQFLKSLKLALVLIAPARRIG